MRLVELSVTNFRSLGDVKCIPVHKQTILTGHNDCGKTATLDSIAFLLGERALTNSDISQFAVGERVRAALPSSEDSDESRVVTVQGRFDLSDGERKALGAGPSIQVRRRYVEDDGTFCEWLAQVPQNPALRNIAKLKVTELHALAAAEGVTLREGQANLKASWVEVLEEHAASAPAVTDWVTAPEHVLRALPQLLYFKGDAAESPEAVVRSILTAKLREYTLREETRQKITDLEKDFSGLLKDDADRLQKLVEERCALDSFTVDPTVQFRPTVNSVDLAAAAPGQQAVSLTAAGAGRSRRISLALWEASQQLLSESSGEDVTGGVIIAYDEPDTHLDYDHQRRIMEMIKASAAAPQSTVIVATHSLNLIDGVDIQDIVHLNSRDGRAYVQSLGSGDGDEETRRFLSNMAVSLGFRNSVLLHERCFIGVEGPTEYAALPALFKLAFGYPIQSAGIALWDCKGNDGALSFAKFLKKHRRTVAFLVDADTVRDKQKEFRLDHLEKHGFTEDDCLFLGDPHELEDVFSNDQWADTMNVKWPRDDTRQWTSQDVEDLRGTGKFSKSLHGMVHMHSSQAPRSKEQMVLELAHQLRKPSDVPPKLVDAFRDAIKVASEAGLRYWPEDD
ncbi:ATP-dependent endonuclease [Streptomyces sp. NPDC058430]|uniref:ATP-dependent nuclease n=1 Tax=Streptomyces sp. NPDC058430 TaxID=3346495 RepID=UPI00366487AC